MKEVLSVVLIFIIVAFIILLVCLAGTIIEDSKYKNFVIPDEYVMVKYNEENFVVMDSSRQKFLVYWDDGSHSMQENMGNLKGGETEMKRHLIEYLEEKKKQEEKIEIEKRLKLK
jgi:hypothetical protein